VKKEIVR